MGSCTMDISAVRLQTFNRSEQTKEREATASSKNNEIMVMKKKPLSKLAKSIAIKAKDWAKRNRMKNPTASDPVKEYWGWSVQILDIGEGDEKDKTAQARFDKKGNETLWELHR